MLARWEELPEAMRNDCVRPYYELLERRRGSLMGVRAFDLVVSLIALVVLLPVLAVVSLLIVTDSRGPVIYRQERVTQNGRIFKIYKFRTMVDRQETGSQVTLSNDSRVTRVGRGLRRVRLDELPQLINIIRGDMALVGTRPEVQRYVAGYSPEMLATLLLPAGVTSEASIRFKDEEKLLGEAGQDEGDEESVDRAYIETVLPLKMALNLESLADYSFRKNLGILLRTVAAVLPGIADRQKGEELGR